MHVSSLLDSLPIWVIREHWVEFPVLQVFVHYVLICRMYICQFQSPNASHPLFPLGVPSFVLSLYLFLLCKWFICAIFLDYITAALVYSSPSQPFLPLSLSQDNFCIFIFFVLLMDTLLILGLAQHWAEVMLRLNCLEKKFEVEGLEELWKTST